MSASDEENEIAWCAAVAIKERVEEEVKAYMASSDFQAMVESIKRRERERMMTDVRAAIEREETEMLTVERARLQHESSSRIEAHEVALRNKLKIEEHQRAMYELKLQQDEQRLKDIQERQQIEVWLMLSSSYPLNSANNYSHMHVV